MFKVLSIAGSDCSGGAGIQADLKTITAHGMYGMTAITALTAQNTMGVFAVQEVLPAFLESQLDCIFGDIYPDAIKIGMVSNEAIIEAIVKKLTQYQGKNIVIDPVMISTSGHPLMSSSAMTSLIKDLLPLGDLVTPNLMEAQQLSGIAIENKADMVRAAEVIGQFLKGALLIKGGHLVNCADDLLYSEGVAYWIEGKRIHNPNTHGTGCTLSAAIACQIAQGKSMLESVTAAKGYITGALEAMLDLGKGSGPLNHCYRIK